jgi:serine/threonine protein kinase
MATSEHKGGKYIAEGSYGCTFHPQLKCKSHTQTNKVPQHALGKIFDSRRSFRAEEILQRLIKKIDPSQEFTVPYYGSCEVDVLARQPRSHTRSDNNIHDCTKVTDISNNLHDRMWPQMMFKYGGEDLDMVSENINNKKYDKLTFDKLICMLLPVCKGLVKLKYRGYSHMDIKPNNMLLDSVNNKILLIDFGLLDISKNVILDNSALTFATMYYPPEFIIVYLIREGYTDFDTLYSATMRNFQSFGADATLQNLEFAKYEENLKSFIRFAVKVPIKKLVADFVKIFSKKIDVYALGMSIIRIISTIKSNKYSRSKRIKNENMYSAFKNDILAHMIDPNPYKRMSSDELYIKLLCMLNRYTQKIKMPHQTLQHNTTVTDIFNDTHTNDIIEILVRYNISTKGTKRELYNRLVDRLCS